MQNFEICLSFREQHSGTACVRNVVPAHAANPRSLQERSCRTAGPSTRSLPAMTEVHDTIGTQDDDGQSYVIVELPAHLLLQALRDWVYSTIWPTNLQAGRVDEMT